MRKNENLYVRITLFVIIAAGFLLRVNHWFDFLGADETGWKGLITWTWDLHKDPFPVHYYPPFFLYLNFVFSILLKKITLFLGVIDFNNIFQNSDFGFIFTLKTGRILSAVFGTFNIYMVYKIGREFFNRYAGLCSALLLSVFWPHVIDSHNFKSDVLLTLLITIVVYYTLRFNRTKNKWDILAASFFLGLSIASKFNGAFFGFILLLPVFYLRKEIGVIRNLIYIAGGTVAGFFVGAPNWLVHPVSNVKATLKYLKGLSEEVLWYDPFPSSFFLYGKNLLEHFGLLLLLILIAGILISFLKKNREEVIISSFMLIYFILAGLQNYLNYRAILPIIPLIVILIGKLIFSDIRELIRTEKIRAGVVIILLIPVAFYSFGNFKRSYSSFDLLKGLASHPVREKDGIGEPDYSSYFIKNHMSGSERVFREMWTPPGKSLKGVVFARDVTKAPEKMFTRHNGFQFLLTSFRTDYILRKAENKNIAKTAMIRLKNFIPFYRVYRPPIFTWSDDIQFWYRRPGYIKGNFRPDTGVLLPHTYTLSSDNPSVHLPLQRYEKDPCTGKIRDGIAGKYIFSFEKIEKLKFNFILKDKLKLTFDVNGKKAVSVTEPGAYTSAVEISEIPAREFRNIALRRLYEVKMDKSDLGTGIFIYKIEVRANTRAAVPYSFKADFEGEESIQHKITSPDKLSGLPEGDIPGLFSREDTPKWVRNFYRKTGVDLSLLSYMNTLRLYDNKSSSTNDMNTDYLPVERGHFRIDVESEELVKGRKTDGSAEIKIKYISGKNIEEIIINPGKGKVSKDVFFQYDKGFIKFVSSGARDANLMIKKITMVPDFKKYNFVE